ncbi:MAG: hypothetical protein LBP52_08775 [Burkholderiaceae bacterium]|jgi:hypothetical protein|nr:hypothetical protein [Burkholderiaceae bacterium]
MKTAMARRKAARQFMRLMDCLAALAMTGTEEAHFFSLWLALRNDDVKQGAMMWEHLAHRSFSWESRTPSLRILFISDDCRF